MQETEKGLAKRIERSNSFKRFLLFFDRVTRFDRMVKKEADFYEKSVGRGITMPEFLTLHQYFRAKHIEAARGWFVLIPAYFVLTAIIVVKLLVG